MSPENYCERNGKIRHATKELAMHQISIARETSRKKRDYTGDILTAYRCPFCEGWHIGHPSGSARKRKEIS